MPIINNENHDYYCQWDCDYNKRNRCQLNQIKFENDYFQKDNKGACESQDLINTNRRNYNNYIKQNL
jgi:hypothetical protein